MRCEHEIQMHRYNCYITLTLNDTHPELVSLQHKDFVTFTKALRYQIYKHFPPAPSGGEGEGEIPQHQLGDTATAAPQTAVAPLLLTSPKIGFYMAGEYGERYGRPHYHALLFGVDFADRIYHGKTKAGERIYRSETLEKLWPHGYSSVGNATFASAAYISRYIMKKRTGDGNKHHYEILDLETGEIYNRKKEYNCMSRNPGIGKTWWDKYKTDVTTIDKVITKKGRKLRPPRYYDKQLKRYDRALHEHTKLVRQVEALAQKEHHTSERLAVQELVATDKARFQTRNLG